jgi:hypothetical protein
MFVWYALRSARQASCAEANIAVRVLREQKNTFWTGTLWADETAMKKFMTSGVHGKSMRKLATWCDEAAVVHWAQVSAALPSWPEAHERLQKDGRRSKVNHPSAGHLAYEFPPPQVNSSGELVFK